MSINFEIRKLKKKGTEVIFKSWQKNRGFSSTQLIYHVTPPNFVESLAKVELHFETSSN